MKQRVIVMNGQRLLETQQADEKWKIDKVSKAQGLKPGIYNIHTARPAQDNKQAKGEFSGFVLHVNDKSVFQKVGKEFVAHDLKNFSTTPEYGQNLNIKYDQADKITATQAIDQKATRKISR